MSILTSLQLLPLFGALVVGFLPASNAKLVKQVALAFSLLVTLVSIVMALSFDRNNSEMQFTEVRTWISAFNINYAVGIDGMALVLILMTTILVPVVFLAGWNESENGRWNVKVFYILLLILETMMIGVFSATDVFLFYVIFEAMLLPVYFLIGGYGSGERAAAAMKFLL
jgi:NADH-quinone oxidoreductase subunit M